MLKAELELRKNNYRDSRKFYWTFEQDFADRNSQNVIPKRKIVAEEKVCQNTTIDQSTNEQEKNNSHLKLGH